MKVKREMLHDINRDSKALRRCIFAGIPDLRERLETGDQISVILDVREWVSRLINYSGEELILDHSQSIQDMVHNLATFQGGMWCGGAATLFAGILNFIAIPATVFSYGYSNTGLSHVTTLVGISTRDDQGFCRYIWYNLDAYVNYHYVDNSTGEWLPIDQLIGRVKRCEYDSIKRVDTIIPRHYVTHKGKGYEFRSWLFDDGKPSLIRAEYTDVYPGAVYTVGKLITPGCPFRKLVDKKRSSLSPEQYLLKLILVNPLIEQRIDADSYPMYSLLHAMLSEVIKT
jgi:hypothetical protein